MNISRKEHTVQGRDAMVVFAVADYWQLRVKIGSSGVAELKKQVDEVFKRHLIGNAEFVTADALAYAFHFREYGSEENLRSVCLELLTYLNAVETNTQKRTWRAGIAFMPEQCGNEQALDMAYEAVAMAESSNQAMAYYDAETKRNKVRVLIVEDQELVSQMFRTYIENSDRYELVHAIKSADMAYFWCAQGIVDLVLMDVFTSMGANGLDATARIKKGFPEIKVIIVTSMPEVSYLRRAREAGADSFWYKEVQSKPLLEIMDRTMNGESIYPLSTPEIRIGDISSSRFTERELDILRELVKGKTNIEIADELFITSQTVKTHIQHLLTKTGFSTRTELAVRVRESGLIIQDS